MGYLVRYLYSAIRDCPPQGRSQRLRPTINYFDYGTLRATWGFGQMACLPTREVLLTQALYLLCRMGVQFQQERQANCGYGNFYLFLF